MQQRQIIVVTAGLTLLIAALAIATVGLGTAGANTGDAPQMDRSITVGATGEAGTAPDKAIVTVSVSAENDSASAVRNQLAAGATAMRTELDELGVEYRTEQFRINEHDFPDYEGEHSFVVTVDDPDQVGSVVDAAATAGAEIRDIRLTLSDEKRAQLRDEAIKNAVANARGQAETIATESGLAVTTVATVDADQSEYRPFGYDLVAQSNVVSTQIDSGPVSVSYQVTVTFNATAA